MRLSARMIATGAFAVLIMGGFLLHAESAARPSTSDAAAADPGVSSSAEPVASDPVCTDARKPQWPQRRPTQQD